MTPSIFPALEPNQCGLFLVSPDGKPMAVILNIPDWTFEAALTAGAKAMRDISLAVRSERDSL